MSVESVSRETYAVQAKSASNDRQLYYRLAITGISEINGHDIAQELDKEGYN